MSEKVIVNKHSAPRSQKVGIRLILAFITMLIVCQSVGCRTWRASYQQFSDAVIVGYRDEVWARRAFNLRFGNCQRDYADHFENGFVAGYTDVCQGGDGYVPALPPEDYRSFEYQSADGSRCVNSWFEGYPAGVAAARKDKSGSYHNVMISRLIDSAIKQDKNKAVLPADVPVVAASKPEINTAPVTQPVNSTYQASPLNQLPSVLKTGVNKFAPSVQTAPTILPEISKVTYSSEAVDLPKIVQPYDLGESQKRSSTPLLAIPPIVQGDRNSTTRRVR